METYKTRYIEHRGHVVLDRAYTARHQVASMLQAPLKDVEVVWELDNPNVLSVSVPRIYNRETKVTKRAFEAEKGGKETFEEREFARVVDVSTEDGLLGRGEAPRIYGRRKVVKYRVQEHGKIDINRDEERPVVLVALEVDYFYEASGIDTDTPIALLKSRLTLRRADT